MLAIELKRYLASIPDEANILIYIYKTGEVRQLIDTDIERNIAGHVIIDAEYDVPPKCTTIIRTGKE